MLVTIIGNDTINKLILPKQKMGAYWVYNEGNNKKMLNIEGFNDEWQISSNTKYKIINKKNINIKNNAITIHKDGNEFLEKVVLRNYNFYYIKIEDEEKIYILFCTPVYEENYIHLHMKNTSVISIGRSESNNIMYSNPLISNIHTEIIFLNGVYWIKNYDKKFNTFLNDKPVSNTTKMLQNGDRIQILDLKIILINKEIFVRNPLNKVNISNSDFEVNLQNKDMLEKFDNEDNLIEDIKKEYFLRTPRMIDLIDETEIKISAPKKSEKGRELPIALVLGSSLSMGAMTFITIIRAIDNFNEGNTTVKNLVFSLVTSGIMLLTSILIPILNRLYSSKIKKLNKKDEIEKYKKYIKHKIDTVEEILKYNSSVLYKMYPTHQECIEIMSMNSQRIWERQIFDEDFLTIRLGVGDVPSKIKLSYTINEEEQEESNETYELMLECIEKAKLLKNSPVLFSLVEKNITAFIYENEEIKYKYIQNMLIQLMTFQSYDELKIVFLLKDNAERKWDFVKMSPYIWNNAKNVRFFANDFKSINEVSNYLDKELQERLKQERFEYKNTTPYYLIIVDDYKNVENLDFIKNMLLEENNIGFSILFITDSILKLPNRCKNFISIEGNTGTLFENKNPNQNKQTFKVDISDIFLFEKINSFFSNKLIKYDEEKEMKLPNSYTFLEMYNVGSIEQLKIFERWNNNDSTQSLAAPIGIDEKGNIVLLDIHEKSAGPHGLIAGSTGSGKSEFIITYILSLAINYHPDDVTFVLIDYKGGGLAGAFKRADIQLPHLVGTITNIDKSSLQRSLESIESELRKRQIKFNEAKDITGESTIDIYKYQKYYHNGVLKEPISHLFIISDEFAELKQQEPEFMSELISIARIGRSLGVHLILATQKPSGIVNDQIRSNVKFGVCLKVQSSSDSKDVIGIPDAAKLKNPGQFLLKVGADDYLVLGQSGWAGALYYPSNEIKKAFDNSIEFISNIGKTIKIIDDYKKKDTESKGEQLTNIVKFISDLAKKENIYEKPLWLNPISDTIYVDELREKYNIITNGNIINPVIGEYDIPSEQKQQIYTLNLSSGGNTIIYGNAESGKETLLSTMIYDIINNYSSEKVQLYILDFGSKATKIFKKAYHVGDIIFEKENEKMTRFFMMLGKELRERKQILSDYNGDYNLYIKATNNIMPTLIIILNNYEAFVEEYKNTYDEQLEIYLREGLQYKIVFVFTTGTVSGIRYRTLQNFKQKIAMQMNKDSDYSSIFERLGNKRFKYCFGRGLINPSRNMYYEFQTAKLCEAETWNEKVMETMDRRNKELVVKAQEVLVLPPVVTINHLIEFFNDLSTFPVGITNKNITPYVIDLKKNLMTFIISNNIETYSKFIVNIIEEIKMLSNINLLVLDAENILQDEKEDLKNKYIEFFKELNTAKKIKDSLIVIIGIDKFINILGDEMLFGASLENARALKKCKYIILNSAIKLNNYMHSEWYKENASGNTGVWLRKWCE